MDKSIGRLISILYRKSQVYLNTVLKPYDITASELPFILRLYKQNGVSQEQLASFLSIDKAAAARAIRALSLKGYLYKEKDSADRRANKIFLTEHAYNQKENIKNRLKEWSIFLADGQQKEQVDCMLSVLENMVKKLEMSDIKELWKKN